MINEGISTFRLIQIKKPDGTCTNNRGRQEQIKDRQIAVRVIHPDRDQYDQDGIADFGQNE